MKLLQVILISLFILCLSSCAEISPPPPDCHYQDLRCRQPSGTIGICRVARWQRWPMVYWRHGKWYPHYWKPWYWRSDFWYFNQFRPY